jgi:guanylate kinase
MDANGKLVVISGPSGVGKTRLVQEAIARCDAEFGVSATTRQARLGEVDGKDYRFVDRATFQRMIDADEMLEWAKVYDEYYGTPAGEIAKAMDAGRTVVLDIDVQGAMQVHQKMPDATFVLVIAPSSLELRRRLEGRGSESRENIEKRLAKAQKEIAAAMQSGVYNNVIVNEDLERAVQEIVKVLTD